MQVKQMMKQLNVREIALLMTDTEHAVPSEP